MNHTSINEILIEQRNLIEEQTKVIEEQRHLIEAQTKTIDDLEVIIQLYESKNCL